MLRPHFHVSCYSIPRPHVSLFFPLCNHAFARAAIPASLFYKKYAPLIPATPLLLAIVSSDTLVDPLPSAL